MKGLFLREFAAVPNPPRHRRDRLLPQGRRGRARVRCRPARRRRTRPRRSATELSPLVVVLAIAGAAWGFACDRISTRWPDHDVEEGFLPGRAIGWRTVVCMVIGGAAIGALPARFDDPAFLAFLVAWFAALTLLLATDPAPRLRPTS